MLNLARKADSVPNHDLVAAALRFLDEKRSDGESCEHEDEPRQDSPHVRLRERLPALRLAVSDHNVDGMLLKIVQLVELVDENDQLDDEFGEQI